MNNDLEYNFVHNQINANNQVRSILHHEISSLLALVHQKRQWVRQLDENDKQLQLRLDSLKSENKSLILHSNISW